MPINRKQKLAIANEALRTCFPKATTEQKTKVTESAIKHFQAGYSPLSREWDRGTRGVGSGCTFREYVIYMGWKYTSEMPKNVEREHFSQIIKKATTI